MNQTTSGIQELIRRAHEGNGDALGELLEHYRAYLKFLSRRHLDSGIGGRLDSSDLVQQTCLSAVRNFKRFSGNEEGEFVAWLRKVHERNLQDAVRDHVAVQKRAIGKEEHLSADRLPDPRMRQSSPSKRAMRGEAAVQLAQALEKLPDDQREAVRLRHLEGWPLADITRQMERSDQATAGLVKRGMQKLRELLDDE